jgi:signal transduction histidine kinase
MLARRERWGDRIVALALAAGAELQLPHTVPADLVVTGSRAPLAVVCATGTLALAWRRTRPVAVLAVVVGSFLAGGLLISHSNDGPVAVFLATILAFYSLGAHAAERPALLAGGATLATTVVLDLARGAFDVNGAAQPLGWLVLAFAWLLGRDLRRRRGEVALLRERAARLEQAREEQARAAVAGERTRIARELHDVVAHCVSVMVVQAQAGTRLLADPELAAGAFRSIEASGREALVELRRLLGILRSGDEQPTTGPQPGLASLDALLEQVRDAGLPVELTVEGEQVALPPGVDLSAYRIVQEALTNTLKHAGPAEAEIVVRYGASALELEVADNGRARANGGASAGHGLVGMQERVALYGGRLEAAARREGGFVVRAQLPLAGGGR